MQYKYLINIALAMGLSVLSTATLAFSYGKMHVQLNNDTGANCLLTDQALLHGNLATAPPLKIMANDSKAFDMEQFFFGPDIVLSYQCGVGIIKFEVQRNYGLFIEHTPSVKVIFSNGINLVADNQSGSVFWGLRCISNISLQANQQN